MHEFYADTAYVLLPQMGIFFSIFTGGASAITLAIIGSSSYWLCDAGIALFGLLICLGSLHAIMKKLMDLVRITNLCSGKATYADPPTIMSAAYRHMGNESLT